MRDGGHSAALRETVLTAWCGLVLGTVDFLVFDLGERFAGTAECVLNVDGPGGASWLVTHVACVVGLTLATRIGFAILDRAVNAVTRRELNLWSLMLTVVTVSGLLLGLRVLRQAGEPFEIGISIATSIVVAALATRIDRHRVAAVRSAGPVVRDRRSLASSAVALLSVVFVMVAAPEAVSMWKRYGPVRVQQDPRPNVVVIVLDTVRADRLGCYGAARARTPNMDRIASEGVRYTAALAAAPWTLPSHASMWTGLYPSAHGATWEHMLLTDEVVTLAERLAADGYRTVGITENPVTAKELGLAQGFEEYHEQWRQPLPLAAYWRLRSHLADVPVREEKTEDTVDKLSRWIVDHRRSGRPFFAFVNLMAAHLPNYPRTTSDRVAWTDDDLSRIEPVNRTAERFYLEEHRLSDRHLEIMRAIYDQEISYLDHHLGLLFSDLDAHGVLDDTILIITSDHGENFGDHGLIEHQLCVYNSLVHVPLIIRHPSLLAPGRIDAWFSTVDLGRVVFALIQGAPSTRPDPANGLIALVGRRECYIGEYGNPVKMLEGCLGADAERIGLERFDRKLRFVLADGLKLVCGTDGSLELYDVVRDFDESTDLATDRPDAVRDLERGLEAWRESVSQHRSSLESPVLGDEITRQLEALGYVGP